VVARFPRIDADEMRELDIDARCTVVPKALADALDENNLG
jgi:hypothetical protein